MWEPTFQCCNDMRLKPRLTRSLPQRRSVCRLCDATKSVGRRAVEGEQGQKHENGLGGPLPFHSQDGQETASRGTGSIDTHKHASPLMSTRTVQECRQRAPSAGDRTELHV